MIEAFLHGKLSRDQERMEDCLTSCVFGTLRLLPPTEGIIPLLAMAEPYAGGVSFLAGVAPPAFGAEQVDYQFWPMLQAEGCHRCEPDLLVTIKPLEQLVLVEAKLFSGKSTESDDGALPYDQLAREWDNLLSVAIERKLQPILVYLTADTSMPNADIQASCVEFQQKRPGRTPPRIYWLSWQHLLRLPVDDRGVLQRLTALLDRLDLLPFSGWPAVHAVPNSPFCPVPRDFEWPLPASIPSDWSFTYSNE